MKTDIFYAELSGSPYEIGYGHGSQAKEFVLRSLRNYREMFLTHSGVRWEDAKKAALHYIPYIKNYDADILEEMRGVADGAGVNYEDILTLNARSEVLMTMKVGTERELHDGCTNILVTPERTENGHTYLAHNWDWKVNQRESIVIFKIHQENKPDILMITEGGIIGKFGVNECGIGVAMNALCTPSDTNGVPLHSVLRGILNSRTLGDAIYAIGGAPNACPANYMMASACGEALACERMPDDYAILYPKDHILVHANHITDVKLRLKYEDTILGLTRSTYVRHLRADKLIRQYDKIGVKELRTVLSDHVDFPNCICGHPDPDSDPICTVFNMVLDVTEKSLEVCLENTCCGEYSKFTL